MRLAETPRKNLEPLFDGPTHPERSLGTPPPVDSVAAEAAMKHFGLKRLDGYQEQPDGSDAE